MNTQEKNQRTNERVAEYMGATWVRLIDKEPKRSLVMPGDRIGEVRNLKVADGTEAVCQIHRLPDYCHDLNAMTQAEATLDDDNRLIYYSVLFDVVNGYELDLTPWVNGFSEFGWSSIPEWVSATASQRAEAFLAVMDGKEE